MKRIAPIQKPSPINPIDLVVMLALALLPCSYYLGSHLDWGALSPAPGERDAPASLAGVVPMPPAPASLKAALEKAMAAAPPPVAVPLSPESAGSFETKDRDQQNWEDMVKRLEVEAISYPGRVAIYLKDLKRNRVWTFQPDDLFPSASLIKVPIMAAVFSKIHKGELALQTRLTLRRRHRVGGSGSLKWYHDGAQFTVHQLLGRMIDESDNTATRMMIEAVGLGYLQQEFPRMGLVYTEIYPEGMSLQSSRVTYENYTTAREMASLLDQIYRGELVDRYSSELMLDIMKHQKTRARLAKGMPAGWEIAHKTGLLRGACHDTAVIFTPEGDYIMAVLTGQNRSYGRAKDFITHLGHITYRYYKGEQDLYAKATPMGRRRLRHRSVDVY